MELVSQDANLLGIAPGDDKQIIADKLDRTSLVQDESYSENKIRYQAYHIIIDFEVTVGGSIDLIGVGVSDPTEIQKTY